jgi:general secretion pathway protein I
LCPSGDHQSDGFTLVEVLVTLAVIAVSVAAIGSLMASNIKTTRAIADRLELIDAARLVLTGLPDRAQLFADDLSGNLDNYRWSVSV